MRPHLLQDIDLGAALELADEVGGHAHDDVDGAGEELGQPRLVLHDRAVDDAIDVDGPVPVVGVLLEHDLLAALPARVAEGAGAHGVERVVGAPLPDRGRAHDGGGARGEDGEERGARLLQHEAHRRLVHHLHRLDVAEEVAGERILAELVGRMLGVELPLDGELDGLGVERRPVVELDALAELERVPEPVLRDRPGLGQPGDDLRAAPPRRRRASPRCGARREFELRSVTWGGSRLTGSATSPTTSVPAGCARAGVAGATTSHAGASNAASNPVRNKVTRDRRRPLLIVSSTSCGEMPRNRAPRYTRDGARATKGGFAYAPGLSGASASETEPTGSPGRRAGGGTAAS